MIIPLTITTNVPGLNLGYVVLGLDRTVFASFSTAGMVEVGNGVYAVAGGVVVPDGGGYVQVWTELDGDADEFIGEAAVEGDGGQALLEGGYTRDEVLRLLAAVLLGVSSGSGTGEVVFKGLDGATERVTATLDGNGNRTAVAADGGL